MNPLENLTRRDFLKLMGLSGLGVLVLGVPACKSGISQETLMPQQTEEEEPSDPMAEPATATPAGDVQIPEHQEENLAADARLWEDYRDNPLMGFWELRFDPDSVTGRFVRLEEENPLPSANKFLTLVYEHMASGLNKKKFYEAIEETYRDGVSTFFHLWENHEASTVLDITAMIRVGGAAFAILVEPKGHLGIFELQDFKEPEHYSTGNPNLLKALFNFTEANYPVELVTKNESEKVRVLSLGDVNFLLPGIELPQDKIKQMPVGERYQEMVAIIRNNGIEFAVLRGDDGELVLAKLANVSPIGN